jgi:hypothetical protein
MQELQAHKGSATLQVCATSSLQARHGATNIT